MKNAMVKFAAIALLTGSFIQAKAQYTDSINVVTTAVPFLRISPDARAGGMGDAGIATMPDASSIFWNQAKIPFAQMRSAVSLTYTPWLKALDLNDVYLISASGYHQLDEEQAISASVRYFSLGNIQFTDNSGNPLQQYRPREFSVDAGYSRKLSEVLGVGIALRYINSSLANGTSGGATYKPGSAVAGDLSLFYDGTGSGEESGFNWGVTLSNLGSKIAYTSDAQQKDYIPANLGLGAAYVNVFDDEVSKLTLALDVNKLLVPTPPARGDVAALEAYRNKGVVSSWISSFGDAPGGFKEELKEFTISAGGEFSYNDQFLFRAGYFYEAPTKGDRQYFTVGAGLNYNMFGINFSYLIPTGSGVNRNPLSNTLRFSLLFNLDPDFSFGGN